MFLDASKNKSATIQKWPPPLSLHDTLPVRQKWIAIVHACNFLLFLLPRCSPTFSLKKKAKETNVWLQPFLFVLAVVAHSSFVPAVKRLCQHNNSALQICCLEQAAVLWVEAVSNGQRSTGRGVHQYWLPVFLIIRTAVTCIYSVAPFYVFNCFFYFLIVFFFLVWCVVWLRWCISRSNRLVLILCLCIADKCSTEYFNIWQTKSYFVRRDYMVTKTQ